MNPSDLEIQFSFPQSDQDHRLQLVSVNDSVFAIVFGGLESKGPIRLDCEDWSLILLAPIKSKQDITISGINVICMSTIESEEGSVSIDASNQLVSLAPPFKAKKEIILNGKKGEFVFGDDTGTFLNYFQLFNKVVGQSREDNRETLKEAQQRFLAALCSLASSIEGKDENLNIHRVLEIWAISSSEE